MPVSMMVRRGLVDAVLARDELNLLTLRRQILGDTVDEIVVGESPFTFSGRPKDLFFSQLRDSRKLPESVSVMVIDLPDDVLARQNTVEIQDLVRRRYLDMLADMFPHDTVFFCDIDEIPSPEQLAAARNLEDEQCILAVPMMMYQRRANWELMRKSDGWFSPKVFRGRPNVDNIRSHSPREKIAGAPGAHLSYLGMGVAQLQDKFQHYGHQEFNTPTLWTAGYLSFCDRYGVDHLGLSTRKGLGLLRHTAVSQLGEVEKAAIEQEPTWEGPDFFHPRVSRVIAAQLAGLYVRSRGRKNFIKKTGTRPTAPGYLLGLTLGLFWAVTLCLQPRWAAVKKFTRRIARVWG